MKRDGTSTVSVVVNPPEPRAPKIRSSAQATGRDGAAPAAKEETCTACEHVQSAHVHMAGVGHYGSCSLQSCTCRAFSQKASEALPPQNHEPPPMSRASAFCDVTPQPSGLPEGSAERKACPVFSGVLAYFPDALAEVARLSKVGNDKHNPGEPLHWSKEKSTDHDDCVTRHQLDVAKGHKFVPDYGSANIYTRAAIAWRALAALQIEIESESK